ncbi:MAG: phosphoribosyltransferase [Thiogranum sp.]|nr:phosphoribosyltransferase [Thiogranum sp.]
MQSLPEQDLRGVPCELVSWETFYRLSQRLARTIHTSWFRPDLIVAIGRGGYMPARILSDYLDVLDLASIKIEHYHGMHRDAAAQVRYPLAAQVDGRRILLVDDVSDSGDTFQVAVRHLREHGEPEELRTAVLHHKIVSDFVPDYYAREVKSWRWIIYPWAIIEDLGSFLRDMDPAPKSVEAFAAALAEQHGIVVERSLLEHVMAFATG